MFRATTAYVERLREEGYDLWTISLWEQWIALQPQLDQAIDKIRTAFEGVILGPGIGLTEADAMEFNRTRDGLDAERLRDEKDNWQNISVEMLNACQVGMFFMDPVGFRFHFPAFLIADLNDQLELPCGMVDQLIQKNPSRTKWISLLDAQQRNAIISVLDVVQNCPEYYDKSNAFQRAINRFSDQTPNCGITNG